jgi:hypothetical protein
MWHLGKPDQYLSYAKDITAQYVLTQIRNGNSAQHKAVQAL